VQQAAGDEEAREGAADLGEVDRLEAHLAGDVGAEAEQDVPDVVRLVEVGAHVGVVVGGFAARDGRGVEAERVHVRGEGVAQGAFGEGAEGGHVDGGEARSVGEGAGAFGVAHDAVEDGAGVVGGGEGVFQVEDLVETRRVVEEAEAAEPAFGEASGFGEGSVHEEKGGVALPARRLASGCRQMGAKRRLEPRKMPRQSRSKATVDALVEAATRVLGAEGYERANVNRIAEVAGVSVGSLYQYFPTKEALVGAVAKKLAADMLAVFQDGLPELATADTAAAVRGIVARALAAFRVNPRVRRAILEEAPAAGAFFATREFDEWLSIAMVEYLKFHRARVRPRRLEVAVRILAVSVESIAGRLAGDPTIDADALLDETTELVVRYLLVDGA
jgi:AcrR family transcriptional regulator